MSLSAPRLSVQPGPALAAAALTTTLVTALVTGMSGTARAQSVAATTTVSSSWVILPSEEVIYRYYPKYMCIYINAVYIVVQIYVNVM